MVQFKYLLRTILKAVCILGVLVATTACINPKTERDEFVVGSHVGDWRDEIIYQLFVDRFANGDVNNDYNVNPHAPAGYHGGDWQGVIDRLDYLEDLGVTALWITPVVKNVESDAGVYGYHGYWTQDFLATNPHFGDLAKLRELVDKAHARGFKVILDIVTNHVGQLFYYDINGNGQPDILVQGSGRDQDFDGSKDESPVVHVSEYDPDFDFRGIQSRTSLGEAGPAEIRFFNDPEINRLPPYPPEFRNPEWYNRKGRVYDWNKKDQVVEGDFPGGLKDLKTTRTDVREALLSAYSYWIEAADFDGFRIDTLKHVEHGFWQHFAPGIRKFAKDLGKDNFFMFGEAFDGDDALIGSFTFDNEVDSVFYFSQKFQVFDDVFKNGASPSRIEDLFEARKTNYGAEGHADGPKDSDGNLLSPQDMLVNFIDNHDIPRFLYDKPDLDALHNALFYLLTMDGIPCIYYGTEQQFAGGNDPHNREDLWLSGYGETETFALIRSLTRARKEHAALRRGKMGFVLASGDNWGSGNAEASNAGIVAFERVYKEQKALVVINSHEENTSSTVEAGGEGMQTSFDEGTTLSVVFAHPETETQTVTVGAEGRVSVDLAPRGGIILIPENAAREQE